MSTSTAIDIALKAGISLVGSLVVWIASQTAKKIEDVETKVRHVEQTLVERGQRSATIEAAVIYTKERLDRMEQKIDHLRELIERRK
jgi:septal ring factor EnvC (AmiA/AmiB activator)